MAIPLVLTIITILFLLGGSVAVLSVNNSAMVANLQARSITRQHAQAGVAAVTALLSQMDVQTDVEATRGWMSARLENGLAGLGTTGAVPSCVVTVSVAGRPQTFALNPADESGHQVVETLNRTIKLDAQAAAMSLQRSRDMVQVLVTGTAFDAAGNLLPPMQLVATIRRSGGATALDYPLQLGDAATLKGTTITNNGNVAVRTNATAPGKLTLGAGSTVDGNIQVGPVPDGVSPASVVNGLFRGNILASANPADLALDGRPPGSTGAGGTQDVTVTTADSTATTYGTKVTTTTTPTTSTKRGRGSFWGDLLGFLSSGLTAVVDFFTGNEAGARQNADAAVGYWNDMWSGNSHTTTVTSGHTTTTTTVTKNIVTTPGTTSVANRPSNQDLVIGDGSRVTLGAGVYSWPNATITNGSLIRDPNAHGRTLVWLTGNLDVENAGQIVNNGSPSDLVIVTQGGQVTLKGRHLNIRGGIIAPAAAVTMEDAQMLGSLVAGSFTGTNANVIFDASMKTVSLLGAGSPVVVSWNYLGVAMGGR